MTVPPTLGTIKVYHISHVENIARMVRDEVLYSANESTRRGIEWRNLAHSHIRSRRASRVVSLPPGGVLTDYVPWYFAPRSPMLYALDRGAVQGYNERQDPVVHLVASLAKVAQGRRPFMFTNIHAVMEYAEYHRDLARLDAIDWPLMSATYWADSVDDPNRCERRQAEFLVHNHVPWNAIESIGTYNEATAAIVRNAIQASNHKPKVEVKRDWYY